MFSLIQSCLLKRLSEPPASADKGWRGNDPLDDTLLLLPDETPKYSLSDIWRKLGLCALGVSGEEGGKAVVGADKLRCGG